MKSSIEPAFSPHEKVSRLQAELARARRAQLQAEADLAEEQAAVNAFRMHCRLKLDELVEALTALRADKEAYLTRLELLRQGVDPVWLEEDEIPEEEGEEVAMDGADLPLLPTDTPRDKAAEKRLYRELARRFHPDLAETALERSYRTAMMSAVNVAYASQDLQALYDLAGELEPEEIAELAGIESVAIRRLRENILQARRQRRKALQQLNLLHQENTARLWRRAQAIEEQGKDWWSLVQDDLAAAVEHLQAEVNELQIQLAQLESEEQHQL